MDHVVEFLKGLCDQRNWSSDWFLLENVAGSLEIDPEEILSDLDNPEIESREDSCGIWIRYQRREIPLENHQREFVEKYIGMARGLALKYSRRYPQWESEYISEALFLLTKSSQRLRDNVQPGKIVAYARETIEKRLRGLIFRLNSSWEDIGVVGEPIYEPHNKSARDEINLLVHNLNDGEREAIQLVDVMGFTYAEATSIVGREISNRRHQAIKKMRSSRPKEAHYDIFQVDPDQYPQCDFSKSRDRRIMHRALSDKQCYKKRKVKKFA